MTSRILAITVLFACVFAATAAGARNVRHPQATDPAFTIQVPDNWAISLTKSGNMLLNAPDHASAFALAVVSSTKTLDAFIVDVMTGAHAGPAQRAGVVTISGYQGMRYASTSTNPSGVHSNMRVFLFHVDATHIAACSVLTIDRISPASMAMVSAVLDTIRITAHP